MVSGSKFNSSPISLQLLFKVKCCFSNHSESNNKLFGVLFIFANCDSDKVLQFKSFLFIIRCAVL